MIKCSLLLILFLFTGCGAGDIQIIAEKSSMIIMIMLFASIGFLKFTPKIQKWNFTKNLMFFFIDKISLKAIFIMILLAIIFAFTASIKPIGGLIAINLFVTSAFLYRLRYNYHTKDEATKVKDTRYFTITLPSIVALMFLFFGGLESIFG